MFPLKSLSLSVSFLLVENVVYGKSISHETEGRGITTQFSYKNQYGDAYGTEWVFFPDGDGIPRFVNLSINDQDSALLGSTNHRREMQLEFRLYTKDNKDKYISLDSAANVLNDTAINISLSSKPLKIVTHGWRSSVDISSAVIIKNAYLENMPDVNVITLDWSSVANDFYIFVSYRTWDVGVKLAEFINALNDRYNVSGDQIHLIGHSLGAHVMGVAGHITKLNLSRITGLDPALPMFQYFLSASHVKLDAADAQYVDIIHTCGGLLGFMDAIGTADFYPNAGIAPQPGCDLTIQNIFEGCSHGRSHIFFTESIKNPKAFPTYKCSEWTRDFENVCDRLGFMGEPANVTGNFYLITNPFEPFGREI